MNKTEKRMKIFTLIMQVIIQAVLLFPWMNMGTWKCNVPGYLIKLAASGDGMSYIKKSLKPLGVLDGADEQMMVQILMLFICELVMVLVIQVIGIVNLILALSNHMKKLKPERKITKKKRKSIWNFRGSIRKDSIRPCGRI